MYLMKIEKDPNKANFKSPVERKKKKRRKPTTNNKKVMVKNILDLDLTHKTTTWNRCV